jgi:RNA recognition motif-containing protein
MNLFVANISHNVKDDALKSLFAEFGEVISAKIINDRDSGESKGFGFVEMRDDNQALQAIKRLSNADFFGKKLVVSKARPKTTAY